MIKTSIIFILLSFIINFNIIISDDCTVKSGLSCEVCLNSSACGYCKDSKNCFQWTPTQVTPPCSTSNFQYKTCVADAQTLLIILCSVGGAVLIAIIIIICCVCRKCNRCSRQREKKRQDLNERQLEDRRAAAEIRSAERKQRDDQIRLKYGIMKGKDTSVEYKRMS